MLQRTEMVRRIAEEIDGDIVELGVDGRLVRLQLEELMGGVDDDRRLVIRDYFHAESGWHLEQAIAALAELDTEELLDLKAVGADAAPAGQRRRPRGRRAAPRLPAAGPDPPAARRRSSSRIVDRFGTLQKIMRATIDDLDDVDGVGETRARAIKEGLSRLAETSILDRYT